MKEVYQILNVNRAMGINNIIPDNCVFESLEEASNSVFHRIKFFEQEGEKAKYRGLIFSLEAIERVIEEIDFEIEETDFYIYVLEVM